MPTKDAPPQSDLRHAESIQDALSRAASHLSDAAELIGLAARFCELSKDPTFELHGLELEAARHATLAQAFTALGINRRLAEFALTTERLSVPKVIIPPPPACYDCARPLDAKTQRCTNPDCARSQPPASDNSAPVAFTLGEPTFGCIACPNHWFEGQQELDRHVREKHPDAPAVTGAVRVVAFVEEGRSQVCEQQGCNAPAIDSRPIGLPGDGEPEERMHVCAVHQGCAFVARKSEGRS